MSPSITRIIFVAYPVSHYNMSSQYSSLRLPHIHHPVLCDPDAVYDDLLPDVHGGAGPRPAAPRVPDARAHLVIIPRPLTVHSLHKTWLLFGLDRDQSDVLN